MRALVSMRRKLAAARRLSPADWVILAEALWEIARAELLVATRRYEVWRPAFERAAVADETRADPRLVGLFETAAANYVRPVGCLQRSIALRSMLVRRGYAAQVRFGVRRDGTAAVDAHAWVEVGGHPAEARSVLRSQYAPLERAAGEAP